MNPGEVYGAALAAGELLLARAEDGTEGRLPLSRWLGDAAPADARVLQRARGPVLDVGCGPGRHVHALARRGVLAVGVDVSPVAVGLARRRGVAVLEASIFDGLPGAGSWASALLLDGNIGIGGAPELLLGRVAALLAPGGSVLAELEAPGAGLATERLRLEHAAVASAWFQWARVAVDAIDGPADAARLRIEQRWADDGRWFAELVKA
jgi:SAM-dependent methyltransferase